MDASISIWGYHPGRLKQRISGDYHGLHAKLATQSLRRVHFCCYLTKRPAIASHWHAMAFQHEATPCSGNGSDSDMELYTSSRAMQRLSEAQVLVSCAAAWPACCPQAPLQAAHCFQFALLALQLRSDC